MRRKRIPAVWQVLKDNILTHRKRKVQDEDDIMICHCKPTWRGGDGCGPDCINRMLCIECVSVRHRKAYRRADGRGEGLGERGVGVGVGWGWGRHAATYESFRRSAGLSINRRYRGLLLESVECPLYGQAASRALVLGIGGGDVQGTSSPTHLALWRQQRDASASRPIAVSTIRPNKGRRLQTGCWSRRHECGWSARRPSPPCGAVASQYHRARTWSGSGAAGTARFCTGTREHSYLVGIQGPCRQAPYPAGG